MANLLRRLLNIRGRGSEFESYVGDLHKHNCEDHDCQGTPSLNEARRDYKASASGQLRDRWWF